MKKLIFLTFASFLFACSSGDDDEGCREIVGMGYSCIGSDCTYTIDLYSADDPLGEQISVDETTYFYYDELFGEDEIVCWEGVQ